jgi:hypothetical protein
MTTYLQDCKFGFENENNNIDILNKFFKTEFIKNTRYSIVDFINKDNNILIEMKSRRIPHNKYETCIIGQNKIDFFNKNLNSECYIVYCYSDGLFYIKYDKELFNNFKNDNFKRTYNRFNKNEISSVKLIPYQKLTKIIL